VTSTEMSHLHGQGQIKRTLRLNFSAVMNSNYRQSRANILLAENDANQLKIACWL